MDRRLQRCGAQATGVIFCLLSKIVLQQPLAGIGLWHEIRRAPCGCKRASLVKTDIELKRDVERALEWEPSIDARDIAVAVKNGDQN